MTNETQAERFMVLFVGEVRNGITPATLKDAMAKAFNVNLERINKLFCGRPVVIKNNLDEQTAQHYCDTLKKTGAVSWIEPMPPFYRKYQDRRKGPRSRRGTFVERSTNQERRGKERSDEEPEIPDKPKKRGRRYRDK